MAERSKQWLFVGTGALFGSLSTVALLKLFSRWAGKRQVKGLLTSCSVIADRSGKEKLFGRCGTRYNGAPDGLVYSDLLKDEVVSEQLTRNIQFFGMESQRKVAESYVVVIGLGGVGSHAASMLLRSGVGRLLLVDFDQVSLSSLNRHAVATRDDVGTPKALCLQKHFSAIFPECRVEARVQLYDASSEEEILSGQPDFVLDCIDNIDTKVALLAACVRRGLRVLSAMGAGARADPTRIRVADLRESSIDPLSRSVRHRLRKDYGVDGGIPVVFSLEKPKVKLLPFKGLTGEEENPSDYQIVPGFRVRIIPVLGTIPAIFGQVMASYVVTQLAGLCVQTEPVVNLDLDHYRILHQRLLEHEEIIYGSAVQVLVDVEEVMYVVKELWHGRSARDQSQKDVGRKMWRSVNELMLVRWDKSRPATVNNLIPLKFTEAEAHESTTVDRIKEEEPEFYTMATNVLKRAEEEFALQWQFRKIHDSIVFFRTLPEFTAHASTVYKGLASARLHCPPKRIKHRTSKRPKKRNGVRRRQGGDQYDVGGGDGFDVGGGEVAAEARGESLHVGGGGPGRHHGPLRRPHRPIRPRRRPLRHLRSLFHHPHRRLCRGRRRRHLHGPRRVLAAKSEADHYMRELKREQEEIIAVPDTEAAEIGEILSQYGLQPHEYSLIVNALRTNPQAWLEFMMKFELGLEKPDPRRALQSALTIALAYVVGGLVPLLPSTFITTAEKAMLTSIGVTLTALLIFGYMKGHFTGNRPPLSAIETAFIGAFASAAACAMAKAIQGA